MPRDSSLLHPQRAIPAARPAATLLLLRSRPDGRTEVLMTRRSPHARFAPGVFVFPGGVLDEADAAADAAGLLVCRPAQSADERRHAAAALRETFEELGILLAETADGTPLTAAEVSTLDRHAALAPQLRARHWKLSAHRLCWLATWHTDRDMPRRYDVPFFIARAPGDQTAQPDNTEQFEPLWVCPPEAIAHAARGEFPVIFPTERTLRRLVQNPDIDAFLARCAAEGPLWTSCPRGGWQGGVVERFEETDGPFGELELVSPDGQVVHNLDWQHEHPVPLTRHVQRLTAPNGGRMTGPGTNTWIVGDATHGYAVIDAGPDDPEHLNRILAATRATQATPGAEHDAFSAIRHLLVTHSHPDHVPGALALGRRLGLPVLGLASGPHSPDHSVFTPGRRLDDGERVVAGACTLRVIHTPGHAANHLCLLLEEDGLLFTGDHILNGTTPVINPPDGDMEAYLQSLDRLEALDASFLLPAHGHVLGNPARVIRQLRAHRLTREARTLEAIRKRPGGTLAELVAIAYTDTPVALHGLAERSLLAHLERLALHGHARQQAGAWHPT